MALAVQGQGAINANPNGSSYTWNFNSGASGTNKWLFIAVTMPNTVNFSSATYDGVAMTLVSSRQYSGISQRQAFYILENPTSGTTEPLVLNFTGGQFSNISIYRASLTDCGGAGVEASSGSTTTPHTDNLAGVTAGSFIYATGISDNAQNSDYVIDGNNEVTEFQGHNTNKIVEGAMSAAIVTGGTIAITTKADFGSITNNHVELLEAGGGGGGRRRIVIC
jgi:hypothetical protein